MDSSRDQGIRAVPFQVGESGFREKGLTRSVDSGKDSFRFYERIRPFVPLRGTVSFSSACLFYDAENESSVPTENLRVRVKVL